ncbi:MAG: hypothetical protein WC971_07155 [Coriobacteriia bacterium]
MTRAARSARARFAAAATVALLSLLALSPSARADRTVGLSTGTFEFHVASGQSGEGTLEVTNDGDEPLKVLVYAANQTVDAKGNPRYVAPDRNDPETFLRSPASWLVIKVPEQTKTIGNTPYLELDPGQRVPVEFSFTVPAGVAPGDHQVLLFFEMFDLPKDSPGVSSNVAGRLGARIRFRVEGVVAQRIEVRPFVVRNLLIGDRLPYVFDVYNLGNVDTVVDGSLTVWDGNEVERVRRGVLESSPVYAGTNIERSGKLGLRGLAPGRYTVRLVVSYAREGAAPGELPVEVRKTRTVWVVPLWLAVAVSVVAGGLALWLAWRGAVRSAARQAEKRARKAEQAGGGIS